MYFTDRTELGDKLAEHISELRGTDAIVVCLRPSSLMVAISMAVKLRAWVLPIFYETIKNPMDPNTCVGAVAPSGEFCVDPALDEHEYEYVLQEFATQLEDEKRTAMSRLHAAMGAYHGPVDAHVLNNRPVILVGDTLFSRMPLAIVKSYLKPLTPSAIYSVVGNATIDASEMFYQMATTRSVVLDVLPTSVFGEDHYFEKPDAYTEDEKHMLAANIALYWA